jgi:pyruvate ferredoxin oxidoreductase gamma subunit
MFGVERRGAPVQAFTRISDEFIRRRSAVYEPDILVVLDPTLFEVVNVTEGLKENGSIIINTSKSPEKFQLNKKARIFTVDVTSLALEILKANIVNTGMLGAFSAFMGIVKKESVCEAIKEHFPKDIAEKNVLLVEKTYEKAKRSEDD